MLTTNLFKVVEATRQSNIKINLRKKSIFYNETKKSKHDIILQSTSYQSDFMVSGHVINLLKLR